jgi:hypothetical protein
MKGQYLPVGFSGVVGGSGIVARAHRRLPNAASDSLFIANSCFGFERHQTMRAAFSVNASPGRKRLRPPVPNCPGICGAVVTGKFCAVSGQI